MPEIVELLHQQKTPALKDVHYCCSLKLLYSLCSDIGAVEKCLLSPDAKYMGNSLPVLFADNHSAKDRTPDQVELYGEGRGGHFIADELRKKRYRVDEVFLGDGAHGGEMSLFIWWPKDKSEGKKPSRIWNREMAKGKKENEKEKPHSAPEPGPASGTRTRIARRIRRLRRLVPRSKL